MSSEFFIDYANLDDFQRKLLNMRANQSLVVTGGAGSGKSLIALHKAKQIATNGDSYVLIVYTKSLRKYFEDGLTKLNLKNVFHYHEWCKNKHRAKYVIVDECQDFTKKQIEEMRRAGTHCLFFGDNAQSIMRYREEPTMTVEEIARSLHVTPHQLYFNYRLTKEVAKLGERVGGVSDLEICCTRNGERPYLLDAPTFDAQLDKFVEIIRNKSLRNVGILLPSNTIKTGQKLSVEYVRDYLKRRGITCEYKLNDLYSTEMDLDFHSNNPKIITWWCAKGLQFKDVFIPGCETQWEDFRRAPLYVALTRCSENLYLGYSGSLGRLFPNSSSDIYNKTTEHEVI